VPFRAAADVLFPQDARVSIDAYVDDASHAEAAARDMLDRLRVGSPSIPWRACFAHPYINGHGSGRCYPIDALHAAAETRPSGGQS